AVSMRVRLANKDTDESMAAACRSTIPRVRPESAREQMKAFVFEKIVAAPAGVALSEILPEIASRRALITAFLALLELTRLHAIYLKQNSAFGEITARANPSYELSKSFSPA